MLVKLKTSFKLKTMNFPSCRVLRLATNLYNLNNVDLIFLDGSLMIDSLVDVVTSDWQVCNVRVGPAAQRGSRSRPLVLRALSSIYRAVCRLRPSESRHVRLHVATLRHPCLGRQHPWIPVDGCRQPAYPTDTGRTLQLEHGLVTGDFVIIFYV